MPDPLRPYRAKREFSTTSEPRGADQVPPPTGSEPRFVLQEHHASHLHWDLRLEHEGVAVSFALPRFLPLEPGERRKAVHTEDHPVEYLDFEGEIPAGSYGAGTMRIVESGTYEPHRIDEEKVEVTLAGQSIQGRYGLFPTGPEERDWLVHRMDPPAPDRSPMPSAVAPMLAGSGRLPANEQGWAYEIKWDGVRALAYLTPGRLRLESRNLNDLTHRYPELRTLLPVTGARELVLDGEIVAFDDEGRPRFEALQRRMHVDRESSIRRLAGEVPVSYVIFDLLYLDGRSLLDEPYSARRDILGTLGLQGPSFRVPDHHVGDGRQLLAASAEAGLEGVIAKRLDGRYRPGQRSRAWTKIKNTNREELVVGGWVPGEGRRAESIGALLVGTRDPDGGLRFAGRVGSGLSERALALLADRLADLSTDSSPFTSLPDDRSLRDRARFARPELVADVEFREWTADGLLRHPVYKGLRDDVTAGPDAVPPARPGLGPALPATGGDVVQVGDRELKVSNLGKVLYPEAGTTKAQVIDYYARIAPVLLPHLHGRPLTLKRYPDGVDGEHFYEKQCPSHRPDWVATAAQGRGASRIDYCLVEDLPTLIWVANLASLELHVPQGTVAAPRHPRALIFDLDPGPPAGLRECAEVAVLIRGMLGGLGLQAVAKTSGGKGMQVVVGLSGSDEAAQVKAFARAVAETLERAEPTLVVSRMTKSLREGRVLVDWSQNDARKTTICVYSLRARERPIVSTPLLWDEVEEARSGGEPPVFEAGAVLERVADHGDLFAPVLAGGQSLPTTGSQGAEGPSG
ncbi:MAG: DNA ligase D [Solirubrobacterales bacterium]